MQSGSDTEGSADTNTQFAIESESESESETEHHPIIAFYDSEIAAPFDPDDPETTLEVILTWTDNELESRHDYIQHLFPIPERSGANPDAPLLTREVRETFIADEDLQENMRRAWRMMMAFFGYEFVSRGPDAPLETMLPDRLVPRQNFRHLAEQNWLQHSNHNHLRITRIIRSMRILGLWMEAQEMTSALMDANEAAQDVVNRRTACIWFDTAIRPVCYPPLFPDVPTCDWLPDLDPADDGTESAMVADDGEDETVSRQGFLEGASIGYDGDDMSHPGEYAPHFQEHPLSAHPTPQIESLFDHHNRLSTRLQTPARHLDSESPERMPQ